jgi:hypothetical protein
MCKLERKCNLATLSSFFSHLAVCSCREIVVIDWLEELQMMAGKREPHQVVREAMKIVCACCVGRQCVTRTKQTTDSTVLLRHYDIIYGMT